MEKEFCEESFAFFTMGDLGAFELLINRYQRRINIWLLDLPNEGSMKEDVIEETLMKAWERKAIFENILHLEGWLRMVARRACITCLRRNSTEKKKLEGFRYISETIEWAASQEEDHTQLHQHLTTCVRALPDINRDIIELAFWGKKSNGEIAELLNLTVNAVVARKCRAIAFLRIQMRSYDFG